MRVFVHILDRLQEQFDLIVEKAKRGVALVAEQGANLILSMTVVNPERSRSTAKRAQALLLSEHQSVVKAAQSVFPFRPSFTIGSAHTFYKFFRQFMASSFGAVFCVPFWRALVVPAFLIGSKADQT